MEKFKMYIAEACENLKHLLAANFVQTGSLQLCQFPPQSHICHMQYMFLTNADDLLGLQLHTVGPQFFFHTFKFCVRLTLIIYMRV